MNIELIKLNEIIRNENQPREYFDEASLEELCKSIKEYGVLQPIIVKDIGGMYEIIAGERRFRASKLAKLETIPAIVKSANDLLTSKIAIVENVQRENLSAIEEAIAYQVLIDEYSMSQTEIANSIGKKPSTISNKIRLLKLNAKVQDYIKSGKISERHGRMLLQFDNDKQLEMADKVIEENLTVAKLESIVKGDSSKPATKKAVVSGDYRLAVNTIGQAIKMIEKSGFKVKSEHHQDTDGIVLEIKISKGH